MTSPSADPGKPRKYQALAVSCPECNARAGQRCWDDVYSAYKAGVHRERDVAFNQANPYGPDEPSKAERRDK